ncbi:MAG: polysaccharide deacetylase family protein [Chloroflexi bacterium]|nr:polysaccharide deacetylase family protein [Chloroflexota bacterium]
MARLSGALTLFLAAIAAIAAMGALGIGLFLLSSRSSQSIAASTPTLAEPSPTPTASAPTATPTPTPTPTATPTPTPTPTPQPTPDGFYREVIVPILMYHHVGELPPNPDPIRRDLTVSAENFEAQLRYLQDLGFETIRLHDLLYYLTSGRPLPAKPIILTFDDGYRDNYQVAFPLLLKYGYRGSFFVLTDFVDRGLEDYLTWPQIEELYRAGMEIGSHSKDHPDLRNRSFEFLVWQLLGSRQTLEAHIPEPIRFFSYPAGKYDAEVIAVLQSAGYWGALVETQGARHSLLRPYELQRIRVRGSYSVEDFAHWLNYWMFNSP